MLLPNPYAQTNLIFINPEEYGWILEDRVADIQFKSGSPGLSSFGQPV